MEPPRRRLRGSGSVRRSAEAGRKQVGTSGDAGGRVEAPSLKGNASCRWPQNQAGSGSEVLRPCGSAARPTRTPRPQGGRRAAATWSWADKRGRNCAGAARVISWVVWR
jgi:hypothetical protein